MSGYPRCVDCSAPVKFCDRDRCHVCHRRAARAARKRCCGRCSRLRHLHPSGICAACMRADAPRKPAKTISCVGCGEQRRNAGHGLCSRCSLADPDRPFRYAAALADRLNPAPEWWPELVAFLAARYHPGGAVAVLRDTGRLLSDASAASPQQLLRRIPGGGTTGRALGAFFTSSGLALPNDEEHRRAAARRRRYLDAVPASLAPAVAEFNRAQLEERDADRRTGRRPRSDITLESRLRVLRDLSAHLTASRPVTGWSEVITADLEGFIGRSPRNRHQLTYVLRHFFGWARRRRLILADPTRPLRLGGQPAFSGALLDAATQRKLFYRWTAEATHPHERLAGLLALLHAASNSQIRRLTVGDVDARGQTLNLAGRPFATPLDPLSWEALQACLTHREALRTLNQHVIVTGVTRTGDRPSDQTYLARALAAAGTTAARCHQTRISQLVTDLDPKVVGVALGMNDTGLVRYLADNVDADRLERTTSASRTHA